MLTETLAGDAVAKPVPRPLLWLALAASAVAMLAVGAVTTAVILARADPELSSVPPAFGAAMAISLAATTASLAVRTVRWMFLLRRAGVREPLRDACIAYLSGFSLLLVPLLIGEIVTRAAVQRSRAGVAPATTCSVNLWGRFLDAVALSLIGAVAALMLGAASTALLPLTVVAVTAISPVRSFCLGLGVRLSNAVVQRVSPDAVETSRAALATLASPRTWFSALAASTVAWLLPGAALWMLANAWGPILRPAEAQLAYALPTLAGGLFLAPGGLRVVGGSLLAYLSGAGLTDGQAALTVLAVRLTTAGFAVTLGAMFLWTHWRTRPLARGSHFDDIAHAYDAQIPAAQREALLTRKTQLMERVLRSSAIGCRGLDAGCGQGWYVARMRELGFDVDGVDTSEGQVAAARRHVEHPAIVREGSVLDIPAADAAYDFAYCINVLHHLPSEVEQRAAFAELLRVLKPGGLLFVHEINTRNVLFRFYMGYVFPSLNCIDEGTERWLLPHRLGRYTDATVRSIEYFTFLPEFVPALVLRLLRPLEAMLEASPLRVYSAHYMAVLQKPLTPA